MNQRFLSVLIFAFVVAAGASFMLYRLMAGRVTTKAGSSTVRVVVASRKLDLGIVVRDGDIREGDWSGALPAGAVTRKDDLIGRGVLSTIYENEPILESRLAPKGAGGGLVATIPKGMRAVAVKVNEVVGVAGFVTPGNRVDVLISGNPPSARESHSGTVTLTLLQNIEVLSAGHEIKKDGEGKPIAVQVVNLLVTPAQAEKLSLAIHGTTIQLVLRNPMDTDIAKTSGLAMAQLFSGGQAPPPVEDPDMPVRRAAPRRAAPAPAAPAPVVKEAPKPFVMEILQGGKRTENKFIETVGEAKQ